MVDASGAVRGRIEPGALVQTHLSRALLPVVRARGTGALRVRGGPRELRTQIVLAEGQIIFAEAEPDGSQLLQRLLELGQLSGPAAMRLERRLLDERSWSALVTGGELAVAEGAAPDVVQRSIADTVHARVVEALRLEDGEWLYAADPRAAGVPHYRVPFERALFEALGHPETAPRMHHVLGPYARHYPRLEGDSTQNTTLFGVTPARLRTLRLLDGTRPFEAVLGSSPMGPQDAAAMVAGLTMLERIWWSPTPNGNAPAVGPSALGNVHPRGPSQAFAPAAPTPRSPSQVTVPGASPHPRGPSAHGVPSTTPVTQTHPSQAASLGQPALGQTSPRAPTPVGGTDDGVRPSPRGPSFLGQGGAALEQARARVRAGASPSGQVPAAGTPPSGVPSRGAVPAIPHAPQAGARRPTPTGGFSTRPQAAPSSHPTAHPPALHGAQPVHPRGPTSSPDPIEQLRRIRPPTQHGHVDLSAQGHAERARLHLRGGRIVPAMQDFERAVELEPSNERYVLGALFTRYLHAEGPARKALETDLRARAIGFIREHKDDAFGYQAIGRLFFETGDDEQALKAYRAAERLEPNDVETTRYLRLLIARQKR